MVAILHAWVCILKRPNTIAIPIHVHIDQNTRSNGDMLEYREQKETVDFYTPILKDCDPLDSKGVERFDST